MYCYLDRWKHPKPAVVSDKIIYDKRLDSVCGVPAFLCVLIISTAV